MKRILLGVAAAVSVLVIIVLGLALGQPDQFKVEREIAISAQPAAVYANLDDFHRWEAWSPWEKIEPSMKKTYTGPAAGTGSSYAWEGREVGAGRMTITDSRPAQQLTIKLEFTKPFAATNTTMFELSPQGTDTKVRWIMTGQNSLVGKIIGVFADMDAMVGKDFEDGLRSLKRVSESS